MAAWAVTGILGVILGLGTRNYLVRESVVKPDAAPQLIGTALVLRVVLSPLIFGAALVYGQVVGWGRDAMIVLLLAAAATVFVQIAEPLQAGFQATERMEYLAYSDIISKSGQGLVGIVVVLIGFGTIGVTACWAVMTGLVVLLDLYWLRGVVRLDLRTNVRRMVAIARASVPYWAFGLFFMIYLWIDFVMLSLLTTNEVVGWYSVPTRLFQTLMFLPVVVATAWLPHFVRGFEEGDDKLKDAARQPIELVLLLSLPIAALTVAAADPVIHLLYGADVRELGAGDGDPRALHPGDVHEHHAQPGPDRDEPPGDLDVGDGGDDDHQPAVQPRADPVHPAPVRQRSNRRGDQSPAHGDRGRGRGRLADRAEGLRRRHGAPDGARCSRRPRRPGRPRTRPAGWSAGWPRS